MEALLGLQASQAFLLGALAAGLSLLLTSVRRDVAGRRLGGVLVVPVALGLLVTGVVLVRAQAPLGELLRALPGSSRASVAALAILVAAWAAVDYLAIRIAPFVGRIAARLRVPVGWREDLSTLLPFAALGVALLLPLTPAVQLAEIPEQQEPFRVIDELTMPGHPMDLAFRDAQEGYMTLGQGEVAHFQLTPRGTSYDLALTTVADGLDNPRGLALDDDVLYVAEMGELPCPEDSGYPSPNEELFYCKGERVPAMSREEGELEILRQSRGRLLAFDVRADGTLGQAEPVVTDLPVANTEHGVNGVEVGPDGLVYVSIGHVDALWEQPEDVEELDRPHADLLGTVIRYSPPDGTVEVFARGLRNVYGMVFGPDGSLYGVDNDGLTVQGWRLEEVVQIEEGAHHGYPQEGTYGPFDVRTGGSVWTLDLVGAAGLAWVDDAGLSPGLLVGGCGSMFHVGLSDLGGEGMRVQSPRDVSQVLRMPGCVTLVEAGPRSDLLVGLVGWRDGPALYVVSTDAGAD